MYSKLLAVVAFTFVLTVLLTACQGGDDDQAAPVVMPPAGQATGTVSFVGNPDMNLEFTIDNLTARRTTNGGVSFILEDSDNFELIAYFPTMRDTGLFNSGYRMNKHELIFNGMTFTAIFDPFTLHVTEFDPNLTFPVFSGTLYYRGISSPFGNAEITCNLESVPVLPVTRTTAGMELYFNGERLEGTQQILVDEAVDIVVIDMENQVFCITSPSNASITNREVWVDLGMQSQGSFAYTSRSVNATNQALSLRAIQTLEAPDDPGFTLNHDFEVILKDVSYYSIPTPPSGQTVWVRNFGEETNYISDLSVNNSAPPRVNGDYADNSFFELYFTGDQINDNLWKGFSKLSFSLGSVGVGGYGQFLSKSNGSRADFESFHTNCGGAQSTIFIKGRNMPIQP